MQQDRPTPRRVLAYARVSSIEQEQHGTSLEGQRAELIRFCNDNGYPAPKLFVEVESGGLGKEEQRVEQSRLMAQVRPADMVLCCKQDRWSRDTLHYLESTRQIMARGARFFSIAEQFDPSTPEGEYASTMMAATARYEHGRIRERTVGARQRLRAAGAFVEGLPPIGYRPVARKLVIEPRGAEVIRHIFALCISGRSVREISADVAQRFPWARGLDPAGVARRLKDRKYLGEINTEGRRGAAPRGQWVAAHEPIIESATWRQAQVALASRRESGRPAGAEARSAVFLLRGMIVCGHCGHVISSNAPGPKASVKHGGYYLCHYRTESKRAGAPCNGPIARYADVDTQADRDALVQIETLVYRLAKAPKAPPPAPPKHDFEGEKAKLIKRQQNIVDAIADGVLTRDLAREKLKAIGDALEKLEQRREREEHAAPPPVDRAALLGQVEQLRRAWSGMSLEEKRAALSLLAERIELFSTATARWERGAWSLKITWREVY